MAEHESTQEQQLQEFTQNLITDLRSGAISAQEALAAGWQYSFLREELGGEEETLRAALLVGGDAFKESLITAFTATQTKLADLPNFASQLPDVPRTEQDIRDVATLRAFAIDRVQKTSEMQSPKATMAHRAFIHTLVGKYSSTMPTMTEIGVESALLTTSKDASATASPEIFAQTLVSSLGGSEAMKSQVLAIMTQDPEFFPTFIVQERRDSVVYTAILDHMECDRPDVLIDVILSAPPTEPAELSVLRATKLAEVAEALDVSSGRKTGKLQFFSSGAGKGVAGGLKKGADGILSLVGEPVREMILAEKVNGTLRDMLKGSQKFVDRLGENFVRSAFFTHVTQDLTKQLGEKTAVKGQALTVFDDLISSIIRGPLDPSLTNTTEGKVLDYYELMRANANAPKGKAFIPPGVAIWDLFRLREEGQAMPAYKPRVWFPSLSLGTLGGWLGNLFSGVVDKTTSFLFTNPRIAGQLSSSRRAVAVPIPIGEDMPLLVAIIVIAVLVLLFIFPSNFNLPLLSHSSKASNIFAALFNRAEKTSLSCINIQNVHLYQADPSWGGYTCINARPDVMPQCTTSPTFPTTYCTIGASGCGSTSMTMILNAFGINKSVQEVWDEQHKTNGYDYTFSPPDQFGHVFPRCLTDNVDSLNILRNAGFTVSEKKQDELANIFNSQQGGENCSQLVLASVDERWASGAITGHIIVIAGVSGTTVTALDPGRKESISTLHINSALGSDGDIVIKRLWLVTNNKGGTP